MNSEHTDDKNAATGPRPVAAGGIVSGGGWAKRTVRLRTGLRTSIVVAVGWPCLWGVIAGSQDLKLEDGLWPFLMSEAVVIGFVLWYLFKEKPETVEEVAPVRDYNPRNLY